MKKQLLALSVAGLLMGGVALPVQADDVATVNGQPIPQSRLDALKAQIELQAARMGRSVSPEIKDQLRQEVIAREVFTQEAKRRGLDKTDDYRAKLELAQESILAGELFADFEKNNPVTDDEAKAEYENLVKAQTEAASDKEYKARHILVENEDEAKSIIKRLKGGEKFEDIAKAESKDPGSATKGGDLGWADPNNFVPAFADALKSLKKGELTEEPVKTQFGYHVIQLEDVRDATPPVPPKFDDVKDQIKERLEQQKLAEFQQKLISEAKVE